MTKFTSIVVLAAAVLASFSAAAPVPSATTTVTATTTATATPTPSTASATTTAAAPEETVKIASGDFDYSQFSAGLTYNGDATWFHDGLGACGEYWNGETEYVVALNAHQMGPRSNDNPACNKYVQITNTQNGRTVTAKVLDKCPGASCAFGSLDLSPAAFRQLADQSVGRIRIAWKWV
ncbi:hypothetical protein BGW42_002990 [Actinomortierella wolfii]|nr:hypothetical protein BGW42_002990 [Actinomortierella wolfii]